MTRRRRRLSRRLGKARKDKSRHTPHVGGGKPLIPISEGGMEVAMELGDGGVNSMRDKLTKDKTKPATIFNGKRLKRVAIGNTGLFIFGKLSVGSRTLKFAPHF